MLKKIITLLLCAAMIFSICACTGGGDDDPENTDTPKVAARTLIAAAQQESGEKTASKLISVGDKDYEAMLRSYLGIDPAKIADGAIALSEGTAANEIIVLVPTDDANADDIIASLETHRDNRINSDINYFPENAELMSNAKIYAKDGYVVMVADENASAICDGIDSLMSRADDAKSLAEKYDNADLEPAYDYESPVPEAEAKDASWFSDAMFIGDSRMKSLLNYADTKGWFNCGADLSAVSLAVNKIYSQTIDYMGTQMTVADAIRSGGDFSKCYIMLGVNELGWQSVDSFISGYRDLVDLVKDAYPDIQIYVIGIMPLGDSALKSGSWLTNDRVKSFNARIQAMCAEEQVYYIDNFDLLAPEGKLPDDAAIDGVHVEPEYSKMLVDCLLSHTVSV